MARFLLSSRAEGDLAEIADYTIETFGVAQARRYRDGLRSCLQTLAEKPLRGLGADELAPKLRRFASGSHVVFYLIDEEGIFVVRIPHQSMDFQRHL